MNLTSQLPIIYLSAMNLSVGFSLFYYFNYQIYKASSLEKDLKQFVTHKTTAKLMPQTIKDQNFQKFLMGLFMMAGFSHLYFSSI